MVRPCRETSASERVESFFSESAWRLASFHTRPRETVLTVMPNLPSSRAPARLKLMTPAFEVT